MFPFLREKHIPTRNSIGKEHKQVNIFYLVNGINVFKQPQCSFICASKELKSGKECSLFGTQHKQRKRVHPKMLTNL